MAETLTEPIVIELGYIPPAEVRGNSRAHFFKKHSVTLEMKDSGYYLGLEVAGDTIDQARVTFAFYHDRRIDLDNLAIGMKPFVDGLVKCALLEDDGPDHVIYGEHRFYKCKRGESKTIVVIEELA